MLGSIAFSSCWFMKWSQITIIITFYECYDNNKSYYRQPINTLIQELKAIEPSIINVSYTSSVMTDCLANQISTGYRWVPLSIMNITFRVRGLELWCLSPLLTIFHYIVLVRFIGGGNRITGYWSLIKWAKWWHFAWTCG
jgi:hypothetical protein